MPRLSPLPVADLDDERRALFEAITGGGRGAGRAPASFLDADGAMRGPFNAMLHRPDLGARLQVLGERLRFGGALPGAAREIAILVVAAHWRARYEWWAHARHARHAGVADADIDAIAAGGVPALADPAARAAHAFARALLATHAVPDAIYADALARLGEPGVVELVVLLGYYTTISMVLNTFEVTVPDGETTPFDSGDR